MVLIAPCFRVFFPLISKIYMGFWEKADVTSPWWRSNACDRERTCWGKARKKPGWYDHLSPQFPKLDPWSSNKTKVEAIRLMITSAAQFLTSPNGASGSSEKSTIMKKYWDLLLTLGSLSSLLSHTCCELFNVN